MQSVNLTWPSAAQTIQTQSESVIHQIDSNMAKGLSSLTAIEGKAGYSRHALSEEAERLLTLSDELDALLNQGVVLTASPYQFQVGNQQGAGDYLSPSSAIDTLRHKLNDHVDKHRPVGSLYCVAIMVCEPQLALFASTLTELTSYFPLPDWCQVARQSTALSTHSVDKFHQPAAIAQPRFKPQATMHVDPVRTLLKQQGAQLATLASLANDKVNVIGKLQLLAKKRTQKHTEISENINALKAMNNSALKTMSSSVWSKSFTGNPQSIASQLNQVVIPNNHQYTVASLLLSATPLTFLAALLCGE